MECRGDFTEEKEEDEFEEVVEEEDRIESVDETVDEKDEQLSNEFERKRESEREEVVSTCRDFKTARCGRFFLGAGGGSSCSMKREMFGNLFNDC